MTDISTIDSLLCNMGILRQPSEVERTIRTSRVMRNAINQRRCCHAHQLGYHSLLLVQFLTKSDSRTYVRTMFSKGRTQQTNNVRHVPCRHRQEASPPLRLHLLEIESQGAEVSSNPRRTDIIGINRGLRAKFALSSVAVFSQSGLHMKCFLLVIAKTTTCARMRA